MRIVVYWGLFWGPVFMETPMWVLLKYERIFCGLREHLSLAYQDIFCTRLVFTRSRYLCRRQPPNPWPSTSKTQPEMAGSNNHRPHLLRFLLKVIRTPGEDPLWNTQNPPRSSVGCSWTLGLNYLRLQGLILQGFWAPRLYFLGLLGHFEP